VDFKQAANNAGEPGGLGDIDWINSIVQASNSVYTEGMSVMQRVVLSGFTDTGNDGNITLNFSHQDTKAGIHAYDWLTSWTKRSRRRLTSACRLTILKSIPTKIHSMPGLRTT